MNRRMILKAASAKAQMEGKVLVHLSLEIMTSADMARDIIMEAGEMLDQEIECKIELVQGKMFKGAAK